VTTPRLLAKGAFLPAAVVLFLAGTLFVTGSVNHHNVIAVTPSFSTPMSPPR
jgi:membrane protein DedA with SNARE-associated domain